jgi:hypothetical protein
MTKECWAFMQPIPVNENQQLILVNENQQLKTKISHYTCEGGHFVPCLFVPYSFPLSLQIFSSYMALRNIIQYAFLFNVTPI